MNGSFELQWDGGVFSKAKSPFEVHVGVTLGNIVTDTKIINLPDHLASEILNDTKQLLMEENYLDENECNFIVLDTETNFGELIVKEIEEIEILNSSLLQTEDMDDNKLNAIRAFMELLTEDSESVDVETLKSIIGNVLEGKIILFSDIKTEDGVGRVYLNHIGKDFSEYEDYEIVNLGTELLEEGSFFITTYGAVGILDS